MSKYDYFFKLVKQRHLDNCRELYSKIPHDEDLSTFLPWEIVKENLDKDWYWTSFYNNPFVANWENIKENWKLFLPRNDSDDYFWHFYSWGGEGVTLDVVRDNPHLPWDWETLSYDEKIASSLEVVLENPNLRWNWNSLSYNGKVATWENVMKYPDLPWDWDSLSENNKVNIHYMERPDLPWDLKYICYNSEAVTFDFVKDNLHFAWNWRALSYRFPLEFIRDHPDHNWDWMGISQRDDITWEFVMDNMELKWKWFGLSVNSSFASWEKVQQNPDLPWDWGGLGFVIKDWEIFRDNPKCNWSWDSIQHYSKVITPEIVRDNEFPCPYKDWNWNQLSMNQNFINKEIVEQNMDKDLAWHILSMHGELFDWDFVLKHPVIPGKYKENRWGWSEMGPRLIECSFEDEAKRWLAVFRIQRWWRKIK